MSKFKSLKNSSPKLIRHNFLTSKFFLKSSWRWFSRISQNRPKGGVEIWEKKWKFSRLGISKAKLGELRRGRLKGEKRERQEGNRAAGGFAGWTGKLRRRKRAGGRQPFAHYASAPPGGIRPNETKKRISRGKLKKRQFRLMTVFTHYYNIFI